MPAPGLSLAFRASLSLSLTSAIIRELTVSDASVFETESGTLANPPAATRYGFFERSKREPGIMPGSLFAHLGVVTGETSRHAPRPLRHSRRAGRRCHLGRQV